MKKATCIIFLFIAHSIYVYGSEGIEARSKKYEYNLSVAAIFKDNAPYLKEWIEYHRMLGVEHFYLYDNCSVDNPEAVLDPYINDDIVTLIKWPNRYEDKWGGEIMAWVWTTQMPAYHHAIWLSKDKTKWLAVIDTDEFITPIKNDDITTVLNDYSDYPGIFLLWDVYGTSDVYDIPEGTLMIELLTMKCYPDNPINHHTKLIIRPNELNEFNGPHGCTFRKQKQGIHLPREDIRINHYINRTVKFFLEYKLKQKQFMDNCTWTEEYIQKWSQLGNDIEDRMMDKYIPELRQRMGF